MRIAYLSETDPAVDVRHWSGTTYHLYHALKQHADVVPVIIPRHDLPRMQRVYFQARQRLTHQQYKAALHPMELERVSKHAQRAAQHAGADFALGAQAYFTCWETPSVKGAIFSDTLFGSKVDFYHNWSRARMPARQLQELSVFGQQAVDQVETVFLTSEFAFQHAYQQLGTQVPAPKKVITHIGANLMDTVPPLSDEKSPPAPLELLWVGVDWVRKGGGQTVQVLDQLLSRGIQARLHIVGCQPTRLHPHIVVYGFLRKWQPDELATLIALYRRSHLFLLPTQADMSSAVLAEAAAFFMPGVANRIGGIADLFDDDQIVFTHPDTFVTDAVQNISALLEGARLSALGARANLRYRTRLNWDTIARTIVSRLQLSLR